jgi:low temperature requirement protein LtrA
VREQAGSGRVTNVELFDRSAEAGAQVIASSADPGRLGRSAYHFVHPIMVAGIIVTAAADELVLSHPDAAATAQSSWMILGGTGLFIAGHAAFKAILWRQASWPRIAGAGAPAEGPDPADAGAAPG